MKRFTAVAATLLVLVLAVSASAEFLGRGECGKEIESQRLSSCGEYLRDSSRIGSAWREEFPRCCEELEQINEECRCQAVNKVAQQQMGGGGPAQGREKREMLRTAQSLTSLCRISPQSCEIGVYMRPLVSLGSST